MSRRNKAQGDDRAADLELRIKGMRRIASVMRREGFGAEAASFEGLAKRYCRLLDAERIKPSTKPIETELIKP